MALFVTDGLAMPQSVEELLGTKAFSTIVGRFLKERGDELELGDFSRDALIEVFRTLCRKPLADADDSLRFRLHEAAEELYFYCTKSGAL
jgi:hypothetical protein